MMSPADFWLDEEEDLGRKSWRSREDEKAEFLFNRNWPLTEAGGGKSFREISRGGRR